MRRHLCILFTLLTLLVGVLAPLARADVAVLGVLEGTASVGQWFTIDDPCGIDGVAATGGRGVSPIAAAPYSREGSWQLSTTLQALGAEDGTAGAFIGTIHICGRLNPEPVTGAGPFCGVSKGFGGQGRAFGFEALSGEIIDLRLYDFGWKQQAGSILPVIGNFEQRDNLGVGTGKFGTAVALVAVSPSAASLPNCLGVGDGDGVQEVRVAAAFAAVTGAHADWNDATGLLFPKTGPAEKTCYDNDEAEKQPASPPAAGATYC